MLEDEQSDEIDLNVPVMTTADQKIEIHQSPSIQTQISIKNEDRIKQVTTNNREDNEDISIWTDKLSNYDRCAMMKEVNDIIDELQFMLKPKVELAELEEKETPYDSIDKIIFRDWARNLWKSEFLNDSFSLLSWKENGNILELVFLILYN